MARRRYKWQGFRRLASRGGIRAAYRGGGGSVIFGAAGVIAGIFAPRIHPFQDVALTTVAVLPGVLPVGKTVPWQVRRFASGYVLGVIAKTMVPQIGGIAGSSQGVTFA